MSRPGALHSQRLMTRLPALWLMLGLAWLALADLPIHCIAEDVVGVWELRMGPRSNDPDVSCGHAQPDDNAKNLRMKQLQHVDKKVQVSLAFPNVARLARENEEVVGTWTMVYDEGFEIRVGGDTVRVSL